MRSHETYTRPNDRVESYELPIESDWQTVDDVPEDFRRIAELHLMARANGEYIDDVSREATTIEGLNDLYDDWSGGQEIRILRGEDEEIIGMLSYYTQPDGTPFLESVGVDPEHQQTGAGATLIDATLDELRQTSTAEYATAQAQSRVVDIYQRKWDAEVIKSDPATGLVTIAVPLR